jgi:hypothetical protein
MRYTILLMGPNGAGKSALLSVLSSRPVIVPYKSTNTDQVLYFFSNNMSVIEVLCPVSHTEDYNVHYSMCIIVLSDLNVSNMNVWSSYAKVKAPGAKVVILRNIKGAESLSAGIHTLKSSHIYNQIWSCNLSVVNQQLLYHKLDEFLKTCAPSVDELFTAKMYGAKSTFVDGPVMKEQRQLSAATELPRTPPPVNGTPPLCPPIVLQSTVVSDVDINAKLQDWVKEKMQTGYKVSTKSTINETNTSGELYSMDEFTPSTPLITISVETDEDLETLKPRIESLINEGSSLKRTVDESINVDESTDDEAPVKKTKRPIRKRRKVNKKK